MGKRKVIFSLLDRVRIFKQILAELSNFWSIRVSCGLTTVQITELCGVGWHGFRDILPLEVGTEKRHAVAEDDEFQVVFGGFCEPRSPRRHLGLRRSGRGDGEVKRGGPRLLSQSRG